MGHMGIVFTFRAGTAPIQYTLSFFDKESTVADSHPAVFFISLFFLAPKEFRGVWMTFYFAIPFQRRIERDEITYD